MDTIKWTGEVTAFAAALQTALLFVGFVVAHRIAMIQIAASRIADAAKETDSLFDKLEDDRIRQAIGKIAACLDPVQDQAEIARLLQLPEDSVERQECENNIILLTNLFERVWDKYSNVLSSRERYLELYDELTLYVWHSLSQAYLHFDQPDYNPLRKLALRCRDNYFLYRGSKTDKLLLPIRTAELPRYRVNKSME